MNNYISLHTHSDYSAQDGAQTTDQIAQKAAEFGMEFVALTDHGRAGGLLAFKKSCEKHKVRPIYGVEVYVAPESRFIKEKIEGFKPSSHMVVLAKNNIGVKNLFKLTSLGWTEGYYHKPRIDLELLKKYREGLIVSSGCGSGYASQMIITDRPDLAAKRLRELREIFGDDFYIEVQNHGLDWQQPLKKTLFEMADFLSIPIVAMQDSHYSTKEDAVLHKYITKLNAGSLEFEGAESYFKPYEEFSKMFTPEEQHAVILSNEIAAKCNSEWEFGTTIWPVYDLPKEETPDDRLRQNTYEGFTKFFPNPTQQYKDRIEFELGVIKQMGFATYFLVVSDFIGWANKNGIASGPGRGSGAGSLVCYCIGITKVDPIKYELYFERFLNPARVSLPDIDSDFDPRGRKDVINYVYQKYGQEKCAQIGTYSEFKPRGSLRDFARVCGYDPIVGEKLADMVPPNMAGKTLTFDEVIKADPKILKTEWPEVVDLARKAEKMKSKIGVHAAGVVISNTDISTQVPLFLGKGKEIATQLDMHDVEEIGLVKYDFLGLKTLTVIQDTIKLVKERTGKEIDIDIIDTEDNEVYKNVFQKGRLDGIFQFENSTGFKDLCFRVSPSSIEDLSAITALFRPGPLGMKDEDGRSMVDQYVDGKNGKGIKYLVRELEPILKITHSVITYQEQIMRICTDLAGYTLAEADNMRKIIGKKLPEKMKLEKEKFISGCVNNNIEQEKAELLFEQIEGFALYSFNKAHSVSYSIVSYMTAWLKHYYPLEFYAAILNNADYAKDQGIKYIHSCKEEGISILPPDVNVSEMNFTIENGTLIFGLSGIKGIAEKGGSNLIEKRKAFGRINTIEELISLGINKSIITVLAECGALEEITNLSREQLVENIDAIINYHKKIVIWEERKIRIDERQREVDNWEITKEGPKPRKLPSQKEKPQFPVIAIQSSLTRKDKLRLEHKTLGFYLTGHPLDDYDNLTGMSSYTISDIKDGEAKQKEKINIPIVVSKVTEIRTRTGKNMANLILEDRTGRQEATIFPKTWAKLKDKIVEEEVCVVHGTIERTSLDDEEAKTIANIIINDISSIDQTVAVSIHPLSYKLKDGSEWIFIPNQKQDRNRWSEASTIIRNIQRIG